MRAEGRQRPASAALPETNEIVLTRRRDETLIGAPDGSVQGLRMTAQNELRFGGVPIEPPDSRGTVAAGREQPVSFRVEVDVIDAALVPAQFCHESSSGHVPDLR